MEAKAARNVNNPRSCDNQEDMDLRRGPWTVEEDFKLINYIATHGEGRWNSLARCAGLKRTGKSCRLRWLNYLRPDVRRGNITLEEQLLILELHSRWGNRWSKIAQYLPGRTDNEIKNYWRTRVQKHAKQLKCDVNSKQFKDTMKYLWMPRLVERIQAASASASAGASASASSGISSLITVNESPAGFDGSMLTSFGNSQYSHGGGINNFNMNPNYYFAPAENSSTAVSSSDSFGTQVSPASDMTDHQYNNYNIPSINPNFAPSVPDSFSGGAASNNFTEALVSPSMDYFNNGLDFQALDQGTDDWFQAEDATTLWSNEDFWI